MPEEGPIAVVDLETTGLWPQRSDRIIEVAIVRMNPDGTIYSEFETLVNPKRDLGPTYIHGIAAAEAASASPFSELAPLLLSKLHGCSTFAAYNARFDIGFLAHEFRRLGQPLPHVDPICCMRLSGGRSLDQACEMWGVDIESNRHSAIVDARATAQLLGRILQLDPDLQSHLAGRPPIEWPSLPLLAAQPRPRSQARAEAQRPPEFLRSVLSQRPAQTGVTSTPEQERAYIDLLDRAMEDRLVGESERDALLETAAEWGLSREDVYRIHRNYLTSTVAHAFADGDLSDGERSDIDLVGRLLGLGDDEVQRMTAAGEHTLVSRPDSLNRRDLRGKRVCFTGECQSTIGGRRITRSMAKELAVGAGLEVVESVGKRNPPNFVVVGDPNSQSSKARAARDLGVRLIAERVFWRVLGLTVS